MTGKAREAEPYREVVRLSRLRVELHYRAKVRACIEAVDAAGIWRRPNGTLNSIGGLVLHMAEHLDRVARARRGEDAPSSGLETHFPQRRLSKRALLERVEAAFGEFGEALAAIEATGVGRIGLDRLLHVVEHVSYHVGQVVLLATFETGTPFDFVEAGVNEAQLRWAAGTEWSRRFKK